MRHFRYMWSATVLKNPFQTECIYFNGHALKVLYCMASGESVEAGKLNKKVIAAICREGEYKSFHSEYMGRPTDHWDKIQEEFPYFMSYSYHYWEQLNLPDVIEMHVYQADPYQISIHKDGRRIILKNLHELQSVFLTERESIVQEIIK